MLLVWLAWGVCPARAGTVLGSWAPIFKGIDHALGTNTAGGGGFPDLMVVHAIRVDLTDPDIQLYASPRHPSYSAEYYETGGYTTTNFLKNHGLQVAINANNFHDPGTPETESPDYLKAEGSPFEVDGVLISQGQSVSVQEQAHEVAAFLFTASNQATFIPTNWPAYSTAGAYTAVTGLYAVLVNGVNVGSNYIAYEGSFPHNQNPRTAFGLSRDRHYLYLVTIDGRQPGYSDGAYDWETAAWLLRMGAWDGATMDGGGSTCLAMADSTGKPIELNRDSAAAAYGRERTVGAHFGVFAKPVPGFFNNVMALPDDTAATITWTTLDPSTSQVEYGPTTNFTLASALDMAMVTNHAVLLTGLTPDTGYYFAAISKIGANQYVSPNFYFVTTNYVTTNAVFDLSNTWSYTTANLDGVNWTAPGYDDSNWDGSGPGLLWVDTRGFPNPNIPVPMLTEMPSDPNTGYPFFTYYFRTHFNCSNTVGAFSLLIEDYIDDGAVFYLNGAEIYRLRMADAPTAIYNATLASGYACSGDATCPDDFAVSGPLLTNLVANDNVLAVEVHNYDPRSPDITFGMSLAFTVSYTLNPQLGLVSSNGTMTLSWSRGGFTLQQANAPQGPWTDVPGPVVSSPFTTPMSGAARFFRLQK